MSVLVRHRRLWLVGGLALLLRLLVMPFTMHTQPEFTGDLLAIYYQAAALWTGAGETVPSLYPPLAFYTLGAWGQLVNGITDPIMRHTVFGPDALATWLADPLLFRTLFTLKALSLPFDAATALLLFRLGGGGRRGASLATFWLLNPIVIFTGYIHGQFDIIPVFFSVLGLRALQQEQDGRAAFWTGISACFKNYALVFLPLIVLRGRHWRERLWLTAVGVLPYLLLLWTAPRDNTLGTVEYRANIFPLNIEIRFGQVIFLYIVILAFVLWLVDARRQTSFPALTRWLLILLIFYYAQTVFNWHYLTWAVPLAGLVWLEERRLMPIYLVLLGLAAFFYFREPLGQYFLPLAPERLLGQPTLVTLAPAWLPLGLLVDLARSAFVGTLLWLAYRVYRPLAARAHD